MEIIEDKIKYAIFNLEDPVMSNKLAHENSIELIEARKILKQFHYKHFDNVGALYSIAYKSDNGLTITSQSDYQLEEFVTRLQSTETVIYDIAVQCIYPIHLYKSVAQIESLIYNYNSLTKANIPEIETYFAPRQINLANVMTAQSLDARTKVKNTKPVTPINQNTKPVTSVNQEKKGHLEVQKINQSQLFQKQPSKTKESFQRSEAEQSNDKFIHNKDEILDFLDQIETKPQEEIQEEKCRSNEESEEYYQPQCTQKKQESVSAMEVEKPIQTPLESKPKILIVGQQNKPIIQINKAEQKQQLQQIKQNPAKKQPEKGQQSLKSMFEKKVK